MTSLQSIAVAVDGSDSAERALASAAALAKLASASLTIVGVVPVPVLYSAEGGVVLSILADSRRSLGELLGKAADTARKAGVGHVSVEIREGIVVDELLRFLEETNPDLLVMGARGLSTASRLLLGSVSDGVLHHAHCSVLVVRPTGEAANPATPRDRTPSGGSRRGGRK